MSHNICRIDDCDINKIKVKKPYKASPEITVFDIRYNNDALLIQTPVATIPYSYALYDSNAFKMDIVIDSVKFSELIHSVSKKIYRIISRYNNTILQGKQENSIVHKIGLVNSHEYKMTLRHNDVDSVMVFNSNNDMVSIKSLQTFDKILCIFHVQRLIVNDASYFWQIQLIQVKKLGLIVNITKNLFETIETIETSRETNSADEEILTTYRKMLKLGIPLESVKHKMIMEGLSETLMSKIDPSIVASKIELKPLNTVSVIPKAPPLPPPPPPFGLKPKNTLTKEKPSLAFLNDISGGMFHLRKAVQNDNKVDDNKKKLMVKTHENCLIPSLGELLQARNGLRKIKK